MREHSIRWSSIQTFAVAGIGVFLEALSGTWDVYSHRIVFTEGDPWWNPAHILLYAGALAVFLSLLSNYRGGHRTYSNPVPVRRAQYVILSGAIIQIIGAGLNELQHRLIESEPALSPAHSIFTVGMVITGIGAVVGLTLVRPIPKLFDKHLPLKILVNLSVILSFSAVWIISAGSFIYTALAFPSDASRVSSTILVVLISSLILVASVRSTRIGFASAITAVYVMTNFMFLVGYSRLESYLPLGILVGVLSDSIWASFSKSSKTIAATILGSAVGALAYFLYFPFSFYALQLLWPPTAAQLAILLILGGFGGLLGYFIVSFASHSIGLRAVDVGTIES